MIIETKAINSKVLERNMNISVYIPKGYENINLPVLYFLHGRGGNENILKELEMDKLADKLIENHVINPLIIVCPYIANSRGPKSLDLLHGLSIYHLIDEIIIYILPLTTGNGTDCLHRLPVNRWKLYRTVAFKNGIVRLIYRKSSR